MKQLSPFLKFQKEIKPLTENEDGKERGRMFEGFEVQHIYAGAPFVYPFIA